MAEPVFNCHVFNFRVFQNDCEEPEEVFGGAPGMILRRRPRDYLPMLLAAARTFLDREG